MLEDLRLLLQIQERDIKIREIEKRKIEKPAHIDSLKKGFELKQKNLENLKDQAKRLEADKKNLELDVESKQAQILKYQGQQSQVKTNAEYRALESEINTMKQEKSRVEDKILDAMMQGDELKQKIAEEEKFIAGEHDKLLADEQRVKDELVKDARECDALTREKETFVVQVSADALYKYNLIFENKDDIAIVPVQHGACGGCWMALTAQVVNEVKRSAELVRCENCSRILYCPL
jgi:hypothetical protein